jgi:two-component system phosphate regulon sensor histidine kinase PhoR
MRCDRTVGRLLTGAIVVLVGLIVCTGLAEMTVVLMQHRTVVQLTERVQPAQLANARLRAVLTDGQRGLRGYSLTGDGEMLDAYQVARSDYTLAVQDLRRLVSGDDVAAVDRQVTAADGWWMLADLQSQAAPRSDEAVRDAGQGKMLFQLFTDQNDIFELRLDHRSDDLHRRSEVLQWVTVAVVGVLTLCAAGIVAMTAVRTGRQITRPLGQLVDMLDRRRGGDWDARVAIESQPKEIRAVAEALNATADETERVRGHERDIARLRKEVRELGYRIRARLSVADALAEAVRGLAGILGADHVLIRLPAAPTGSPQLASLDDEHVDGPLTVLAACEIDWLGHGDVWATDDTAPAGNVDPPPVEREAWAEAGDGPVLIVSVNGAESCIGAITMIRRRGDDPYSQVEIRLAEVIAGDLARGVEHGRLFEREQHLVSQLRGLDNAKTDFMSTVSHELRTPLTSISGYLELLLDAEPEELSDAQLRMLEVIGRNTRRLRELIEDMLTLSKIESGGFRSDLCALDLAEVIGRAVAAIGPSAEKASVGLHLDVRGPLSLHGDGPQLDRVLGNLLSNAVKFTPPDGTVTVRAERKGEQVVLVVADTGMGIPADEQEALFARFFRATNAVHHAIPGTGLGLVIVRTIVNNHHGSIEVTSTETVGTAVTVRLPAN